MNPPGWPREVPVITPSGPWQPSRPTLLMVHGAGGTKELFRGLGRILGRHFNTLALDLPGHGQNPQPFPDSIPALGRWLAELITTWAKPLILLGHSMGGAAALEAARNLNHTRLRLVLVCTATRLPLPPWESLEPGELAARLAPKLYSPHTPQALVATARQMIASLPPGLMRRALVACSRWQAGPWLAQLKTPALVIAGANDQILPPALAQDLAQILQAPFALMPTGHMPQAEAPSKLAGIIRGWLIPGKKAPAHS